jgi:hypothetical protein
MHFGPWQRPVIIADALSMTDAEAAETARKWKARKQEDEGELPWLACEELVNMIEEFYLDDSKSADEKSGPFIYRPR